MAHRRQLTRLKAPYLKRILLDSERVTDWEKYPWNLPLFRGHAFELEFTTPITIIVGENGTGKSTLLEAIGALAGYDEAGGGKGYRPVDHSGAIDRSGAALADTFRGHWLPKVTAGWFFRAESFYSVARYLDQVALEDPFKPPPPDFCPGRMAKGSSASSRNVAAGKASTSSTSPKVRCLHRARSNFSRCCGAWIGRALRK